MTIKPGSRITYIGSDGVARTDVVTATGYRSAQPAIYAHQNGWQLLVRRLTPRRWRKPVPVIRESQPAQVLLGFKDQSDPVRFAQRQVEQMNTSLTRILRVHEEN